MFQNTRVGAPLYILHKTEPKIEVGEAVSVTPAVPNNSANFQNGVYLPPKHVVDIQVKIGADTITLQQLPADAEIADFTQSGMTISESKALIVSEIEGMRKNSERIVESVEKHKGTIESCRKMLRELNPEIEAEEKRAEEFDAMKNELAEIKAILTNVAKRKEE